MIANEYLDLNFADANHGPTAVLNGLRNLATSAPSIVGTSFAILTAIAAIVLQIEISGVTSSFHTTEEQTQALQLQTNALTVEATGVDKRLEELVHLQAVRQANGRTARQLAALFSRLHPGAQLSELTLDAAKGVSLSGLADSVSTADSVYRLLNKVSDYSASRSDNGLSFSIGEVDEKK